MNYKFYKKNVRKYHYIYFFGFLAFSIVPIFKLFIFKNFNHFFIYDDISFENVLFYLTKSYSLINNKSFFFYEAIDGEDFLLSSDIIPTIITIVFIYFFKSFSAIFINIIFTFITLMVLFFSMHKILKITLNESFFLSLIIAIFLGVGPDSLITLKNYFLFNELRSTLLFRSFPPQIILFFFVLYLYFLDKFIEKPNNKNLFVVYIFTFINIFSYFYSALIIFVLNFIISFNFFKKKFSKLLFINFFSLLGCLFYLYLYFTFRDYTQGTSFVVKSTFSEFNIKNLLLYRDNILSIIFLIIIGAVNDLKQNEGFKKIALLYMALLFLVLMELIIGFDFQIQMHLSQYYLRPLNWITLFLLFFNIKLIFFLKKYLIFLSLFLIFLFNIHSYKYYFNVYELEKNNLQKQRQVISDIYEIKLFLIKNNLKNKQVYISDAFTNMIFSSIVNMAKKNVFILNNGLFRTNKPDVINNIDINIQYCLYVKLEMLSCYKEFLSYDLNNFFNNSFILTGKRNFELDYFNKKYILLNETRLKYNFNDNFFLILNSSANYTNYVKALLSKGFKVKVFSGLTLFYYD